MNDAPPDAPTPEVLIRPAVFEGLPRLVAGFTTRQFADADEPLNEVRARLVAHEGMTAVASVGQVHGKTVAAVESGGHIPEHDGLATRTPGLLLTVLAADCGLVLLADPEAGVVGACHSGWRGTVAGIVGETVRAMEALGADARRMHAAIGPCISAEAFEVGEEVADQFPSSSVQRRGDWPRPHIDLRGDLARQLDEAGVRSVDVSEACTVRDLDRLFSYRAEDGKTGRMVGFIGLRA